MVVGQEITYKGLAHCGAHRMLDLSLKEAPSNSQQCLSSPLSFTYLTTRCCNYPSSVGSPNNYYE